MEINGKPVCGRPSIKPTAEFFDSVSSLGKVYDEDPYMTVYTFRDNIYSMYGKCLTAPDEEYAGSWIELIDGPQKAMLIDTGFGIGNLKGLVHRLIGDKELIVVNTHCHSDHSGGNSQFGQVYCFEYEEPDLRAQMNEERFNAECERFSKNKNYCKADMLPFKEYEIIPCKNNTVFDLGDGHLVEMIFLPGHTAGGCVFLDKKNRILFSGDAIMGPNQNIGFRSVRYHENIKVTAYRNELVKLAGRLDEFDILFSGHRKFMMDKSVVTDVLQACNDIIDDPDCNEVYEMMMGHLVKIHTVGAIGMTYADDQI